MHNFYDLPSTPSTALMSILPSTVYLHTSQTLRLCRLVCASLFWVIWVGTSPIVTANTDTNDTARTSTEIELQTSALAGFRYYDGKSVWSDMHEGDALTLEREPNNLFDQNAIRVTWHGVMLGYVPRRENSALARLIDHKVLLKARIVRLISGRNPWRRVLFEVYRPLS